MIRGIVTQRVHLGLDGDWGKTVLLGRGTTVGDRTTITETIISRRVTVGSDCAIKGSYLWNDVVVGDGVSISYSILAGGVTVKVAAARDLYTREWGCRDCLFVWFVVCTQHVSIYVCWWRLSTCSRALTLGPNAT